MEENWE